MPDQFSARASDRWCITEKGHYDLLVAGTCDCDPRLAGLLLECPKCGTVYGSVRNWNVARKTGTEKRA
jgi:hypothetical protein